MKRKDYYSGLFSSTDKAISEYSVLVNVESYSSYDLSITTKKH